MKHKVIYMTGAPAAGKTTLSAELMLLIPGLLVFEYGKEMTTHLGKKDSVQKNISQDQLKSGIENFVDQQDIDIVDQSMIDLSNERRATNHVLIDSHHVTKEEYGFRASVFSKDKLIQLAPDEIWILYTDPATTIERIEKKSEGRPMISGFEAEMHTFLQAGLAMNYSAIAGIPAFFFDTGINKEIILKNLCARLEK